MIIKVETMEVWRLDSSRKIVVCAPNSLNKFCLISAANGESTPEMTGKEVFDYLVYGKNPLFGMDRSGTGRLPIYVKEFSLRKKLESDLENFGPYASRYVWSENVTDEQILKYQKA